MQGQARIRQAVADCIRLRSSSVLRLAVPSSNVPQTHAGVAENKSRVYTTKRNQHGVATSTATVNSGLSPEALAGLPSAMTMNKGLKRNVKESDSSVVWHKQDKKLAEQSMIAPLLPQDIRFGASVAKRSLPHLGVNLMIGIAGKISDTRPGNGGFRLWEYPDETSAECEAMRLAQGMEVKHATYNTGFAGAKVVCNASAEGGKVADVDKVELMRETAQFLSDLKGSMYTGCDLNTTMDDMENLDAISPYVLAAMGNEFVNPNDTTAFGVVGAVEAVLDNVQGKTLLVHGCGAVGGTVARELIRSGAKVYTIDANPEKADIFGAINISKGADKYIEEWWKLELDALVPCSISGLITEEVIAHLGCKAIVGATNLPFKTVELQAKVEASGITFVPEGVSSAGAVIVDSIEHYDKEAFCNASPIDLYEFCRYSVRSKSVELIELSKHHNMVTSAGTPIVMEEFADAGTLPIGKQFRFWVAGRNSVTAPGTCGERRAKQRIGTAA